MKLQHHQTFRENYGPWAVVTGASSGIGAEFARQLAQIGINLVLVARREQRLLELAAVLSETHGVQAAIVAADLAQQDFLASIQAATDAVEVGLLINCAGFSMTGELLDTDVARQAEMIAVNCRAPLLLSHFFGRKMRERRRGGIIMVASIVGFHPTPLWANYSATKAYAIHLAEALANELKPHNVAVMALAPGATYSEFAQTAGITESFVVMQSADVVRAALAQLGRKTTVVPGLRNKLVPLTSRLLPRATLSSILRGLIAHIIHPVPIDRARVQ